MEIRVYTLSFELSIYLKPAGISVITSERNPKPLQWMRGSLMQRQNKTPDSSLMYFNVSYFT